MFCVIEVAAHKQISVFCVTYHSLLAETDVRIKARKGRNEIQNGHK
jgi:hypothetical protein